MFLFGRWQESWAGLFDPGLMWKTTLCQWRESKSITIPPKRSVKDTILVVAGGSVTGPPPPPRSAVSRAHATIRGSVQWLRLCQPFTGSLGFSVVSFVEWLMAVAGLWSWIRAVAEPSALMSWQAAWTLEDSFLPSDWPSTGNIEFEDYRLQYREGLDWALNNISINILDKEKVQKAFDHY